MMSAATTPGIQPKHHKIKTINIEPQPLSKTAKGGQIIDRMTRQKLIRGLFDVEQLLVYKSLNMLQNTIFASYLNFYF